MRLYCFPYAGGGASIFREWPSAFADHAVEVVGIELPGRERRRREPPVRSLRELVIQLAPIIEQAPGEPFAFFGHSMGALIAFELVRELRRRGSPTPQHLFVSGARAPSRPGLATPLYRLSDDELLVRLRDFSGTPEEVLQHPAMARFVLPILKADFELCGTYAHYPDDPLECPISAFGGLGDEGVSEHDLASWASETRAGFSVRMLEGDHFFIREQLPRLAAAIAEDLAARRYASRT